MLFELFGSPSLGWIKGQTMRKKVNKRGRHIWDNIVQTLRRFAVIELDVIWKIGCLWPAVLLSNS